MQLRKAAEVGHVAGMSLQRPREVITQSCEDETWISLETPRYWRSQNHATPAKERCRQGVEPAQETKKHAAVNKAERSWRSKEHFDIRHGGAEFGVCPAVFCPVFLQILFPFGMVIYILCYYMLEVCDMLFKFDFTGYS